MANELCCLRERSRYSGGLIVTTRGCQHQFLSVTAAPLAVFHESRTAKSLILALGVSIGLNAES